MSTPTNLRHLPNALTILRMLLVPLLALRVLQHDYTAALCISFIAAVTDALDGLLARRFGWQSRLGGILDPLADKLMLIVSFVVLTMIGAIPLWLTLLIVSRDLVIVAGAVTYHYWVGPFDASPSMLSKITTVFQLLLVLLILLQLAHVWPAPDALELAMIVATALLCVASGLHYVLRWGGQARRALKQRRQHRNAAP
ncbi:MAG: CDP-alcohol phosphatidyltransferase family protein [Dokdonella sp.]